ncbi:MAG: hypothetical protein IPQ09_13650 [Myxococcales bacterium]|jgi:hypothetical protein|nr:hypothetical protein [Myxococcales bacterium]
MMSTWSWRAPLLALALLAATSCGGHRGGREHHRASAVPQESYVALIGRLDALAASAPERLSVTRYGVSSEGRDLVLATLGRTPTSGAPRPAIVLTQVVHGDEYIGVVDRLPAELLRAPREYPNIASLIDRGGLLLLLPVVNPDGYEAVRRENAAGADLNRDFDVRRYADRLAAAERGVVSYSGEQRSVLAAYVAAPKATQPESRALVEGLSRAIRAANVRVKIFIDYHCCQEDTRGALLHSWGDTVTLRDGTLAPAHVERYSRASTKFARAFPEGLFGSGVETIGYMTFGTLDEWAYESFSQDGALAFTYEGQGRREDRQLSHHARFLDALAGEVELASP